MLIPEQLTPEQIKALPYAMEVDALFAGDEDGLPSEPFAWHGTSMGFADGGGALGLAATGTLQSAHATPDRPGQFDYILSSGSHIPYDASRYARVSALTDTFRALSASEVEVRPDIVFQSIDERLSPTADFPGLILGVAREMEVDSEGLQQLAWNPDMARAELAERRGVLASLGSLIGAGAVEDHDFPEFRTQQLPKGAGIATITGMLALGGYEKGLVQLLRTA